MKTTLKTLIKKFRPLKKNKINTKLLIVELMRISSNDFSVGRLIYKLNKCGHGSSNQPIFKWLNEMCEEQTCVFVGYRPEKIDGRIVAHEAVFGLID